MKHRAMGNSIKVYDKGGSILRIETTINKPGAYRSYRSSEAEPEGDKQWRVMRRGVADMYRRAEVSQAANDRYAEALASLDTTTPLGRLAATVCRPVSKDGKRYRALHPFSSEDRAAFGSHQRRSLRHGRILQSGLGLAAVPDGIGRSDGASPDGLEGFVSFAYPSLAWSDPQITWSEALSYDHQRPPNRDGPFASATCNATTT